MIVVIAIILRTWLIEGCLIPMRVAGASMANSYLGPHFRMRCAGCEFIYPVDAGRGPPAGAVSCPNCHHVCEVVADLSPRLGDRLLVDRLVLDVRQPRRWEPVVFRCPSAPSTFCIKRIVGLPGEMVTIEGGDAFINGRVAKKSLDEFRRIALPVCESRFHPDGTGSGVVAWAASGQDDRVTQTETGFCIDDAKRFDEPAWVCYRGDVTAHNRSKDSAFHTFDGYGYNQGLSRLLNKVHDKLLIATVRANGSGMIGLTARYYGENFLIKFYPAKSTGTLFRQGRSVMEFQTERHLLSGFTTLYFAVVDGQILFAIDEENCLVFDIPQWKGERRRPAVVVRKLGPDAEVAIGASQLGVEIVDLKLLRDVFYTQIAADSATVLPRKLGRDEYFVLGDNSPVSRDSRHGDLQILNAKYLLGKPLATRR